MQLQPSTTTSAGDTTAPPIVHEVLNSPGRPLDAATRNFMEPRFGANFSNVRVHTGDKATESAKAVDALAYTVGKHLVFNEGQYRPGDISKGKLLAHELAHVAQQGHAPAASPNFATASPLAARVARSEMQSSGLLQRFSCDTGVAPGMSCSDAQGAGHPPGLNLEHFDQDQDRLKPAHATAITTFITGWVGRGSRETLEVHGYASCDGPANANVQLSCNRAEKVKTALAAGGVTTSITTFAHGETDEFGPGLDVNRRVIIKTVAPLPPPPAPLPLPLPPAPACLAAPNPDHSGRGDNPTTASENVVAFFMVPAIDVIRARLAASDAFDEAAISGLPGAFLGQRDAFRHCVWNCFMAQRIGATEAEMIASGHENSGPSTIPFDNQQDFHDNFVGRSLGTPTADCPSACRDALFAGQLRTIRGPNADSSAIAEGLAPSSPSVTTPCIGASNQPWP